VTHQDIERRDIVESYLRGRLPDDDRQAFEEHFFACDECFAMLKAAEKFAGFVRQAAESGALPAAQEESRVWPAGWLRPAFAFSAAAVLILSGLTGWLALVEMPRLRRESASQSRLVEQQRQHGAALEKQLAMNRPPAGEANLPLLMLEASRASTSNTVTVPAGASHLVLWIEIGPGARSESFRLEIRTLAGQPVETLEGLVRNGYGALAASLPAERVQPGTYKARLFGMNGRLLAEYPIVVRR
jgi:Putative zinc-finger